MRASTSGMMVRGRAEFHFAGRHRAPGGRRPAGGLGPLRRRGRPSPGRAGIAAQAVSPATGAGLTSGSGMRTCRRRPAAALSSGLARLRPASIRRRCGIVRGTSFGDAFQGIAFVGRQLVAGCGWRGRAMDGGQRRRIFQQAHWGLGVHEGQHVVALQFGAATGPQADDENGFETGLLPVISRR